MKTRTMLLLMLTIIATAIPYRAMGVTLQWTNALPVNAAVTDLMPDGKGGVVICYTTAIGACARYVDKKGVQLWVGAGVTFNPASELYADYISSKVVVLVVCQSGSYKAYQINLKTGILSPIATAIGSDYMFGPTVPTANKDAKGFFLVRRVVATGACIIERYSYK